MNSTISNFSKYTSFQKLIPYNSCGEIKIPSFGVFFPDDKSWEEAKEEIARKSPNRVVVSGELFTSDNAIDLFFEAPKDYKLLIIYVKESWQPCRILNKSRHCKRGCGKCKPGKKENQFVSKLEEAL